MGCIYAFVYIPIDKIIYVGQYTYNFCSIKNRSGGKKYSHYKGQKVYDFIIKAGYENIKTICLEDHIPTDVLNDLEKYYIAKYKTFPVSDYTFNCNLGGSGHSEESYDKWEDNIIIYNYSFLAAKGCAELINKDPRNKYKRSARSVGYRARCLGCKEDFTLFCAEQNKYYESPSAFAQEFSIKSVGMVCCAALGTRETIGGTHVAYAEDKNRMAYIAQFIGKSPNDSFYKTRHWPVYCAEDDITYKSLAEMQKLGIATRALVITMNAGKTYYNGKHYAFINNLDMMQSIQKYKNKKPCIKIDARRKALYCLELDRIFECGNDIEIELGIKRGNIYKVINDWSHIIGGYHWCYLKDKEKLISLYPNLKGCGKKQVSIQKKVKCIETEQIFISIKEASDFYNIQAGHIVGCCIGRPHCNTAGKLSDGTRLHWEYVE